MSTNADTKHTDWFARRRIWGITVAAAMLMFNGQIVDRSYGSGSSCGDERDSVIQEYVDQKIPFTPTCTDLSRTVHSSHFSFSELNTGDYHWAILRDKMLAGIETTRATNGAASLIVNSGYRNPRHNAKIPGSAFNSRHLHGDAIDFQSIQATWKSLRQAGKAAGACAEPDSLSGWGHVHLDWRGACPQNW